MLDDTKESLYRIFIESQTQTRKFCVTMKILHVWDECGIAGMLSRELRKKGIVCDVLKRDGFDTGLKQDAYYNTETIVHLISPPKVKDDASGKRKLYLLLPKFLQRLAWRFLHYNRTLRFYISVMKRSRQYDILHIHSLYWVALFVPFKTKLFLFHGDDIRQSPSFKSKVRRKINRTLVRLLGLTNQLYVSTPDLVTELPKLQWMQNPIDSELFIQLKPNVNPKNKALYFMNWYDDYNWAKHQAKQLNCELTILNRSKQEFVQYEGMPRLLSYFEYFIDRVNIKSLSKTALEALACGVKVVRYDGKVIKELPPQHKLKNVANKWLSIYKQILVGK